MEQWVVEGSSPRTMSIRRGSKELPEQGVTTDAGLPSLGALSLDVHGTDPTGAGTAKRQAGEICTLGTRGWGICTGPQKAEDDACLAIPVSNDPDERVPSVVPCIGGIYKLLRLPGLSNGIIYESDYNLGDGHMCCVISDNTQYMGINQLYSTIETVPDIRKTLVQNPGPMGVSGAKSLRDGMDEIFYSEPKPPAGAPRTITAYATSVEIAFGNMLAKKEEDDAARTRRRSLGMPVANNDQMFQADTAKRAWKNINLFVRLTTNQLNRIYWFDEGNADREMRANNRAVFAQHYLYLGTWKLERRDTQNGDPGIVLTPTALNNNAVHDTFAMHELSKHVPSAGSQAEALVVQALTQLSSPEYSP